MVAAHPKKGICMCYCVIDCHASRISASGLLLLLLLFMFECSKPLHTCRQDQPVLAHSWNASTPYCHDQYSVRKQNQIKSVSSAFLEVLGGRKEHSANLGVFDIWQGYYWLSWLQKRNAGIKTLQSIRNTEHGVLKVSILRLYCSNVASRGIFCTQVDTVQAKKASKL